MKHDIDDDISIIINQDEIQDNTNSDDGLIDIPT